MSQGPDPAMTDNSVEGFYHKTRLRPQFTSGRTLGKFKDIAKAALVADRGGRLDHVSGWPVLPKLADRLSLQWAIYEEKKGERCLQTESELHEEE